jgi:hypothetical protein
MDMNFYNFCQMVDGSKVNGQHEQPSNYDLKDLSTDDMKRYAAIDAEETDQEMQDMQIQNIRTADDEGDYRRLGEKDFYISLRQQTPW